MNLFDLDTPALIVDLDRLERNIARMAKIARDGEKTLRPHTKTHKTPEIAQMQIAAGASGLTVAKLGEAEVYADHGFDDIFIANEIVGAPKVDRLVRLARRISLIVGVDSLENAIPIAEAAESAGIRISVRLEVDTGLGRAGVRSVEQAVRIGKRLNETDGIRFSGVFTHEGHVSRATEEDRPAACSAAAEKLRDIRDELTRVGVEMSDLSVGSTPGVSFMAHEQGVTELRPGVYVFGDMMQCGFGFDLAECALMVLGTIVSRPDDRTAILDSGTKALSGDRAAEGSKHGLVLQQLGTVFDWANEEHGHLDLSESTWNPRIGEKVQVIPYHACATVNMHDEIYAVRGETVEAVWKVAARGKIR